MLVFRGVHVRNIHKSLKLRLKTHHPPKPGHLKLHFVTKNTAGATTGEQMACNWLKYYRTLGQHPTIK